MAATIGPRALRPLRSCPSLLSVSRSHAVAQCRTNTNYTRLYATPTKKAAATSTTPIKPTYSRSRPVAPAKSAAAAPAARPRVEYPPGVLDPQAAIVPPESAPEPPAHRGPASSLPPVPEPSPFASGFSSPQPNGNGGGNGLGDGTINWSESYHGLAQTPFSSEAAAILMAPLDPLDVEVKPDGIIYLPEIKYRRILNRAFGPGGWGLAPRGDLIVGEKIVTREYALVAHGRFVAQARGENPYFSDESIPTAGEGCKSNALMRCCKDLGIGSELWDPRFIREFKKNYSRELWVEHVVNKKKRQIWIRKDGEPAYPYKKSA